MSENNFVGYRVEAWDTLQHLFKVKKINDRTLHFAARFSGQLDLHRMNQAVDLSAEAFPLIKCGFQEAGGRPCWQDKGYTSQQMVKLIEAENADDSVLQFLYREAEETNGPQLKVGIIRSGENDALCVTINHMLCDAAGFKEYLYLLSSIYMGIGGNANRPATAMASRKIRQITRTFPMRKQLKMMLEKNDMSAHDAAKFDFEGDLSNPFIEMRTIPREQFLQLKAYAKAHSATVNDVMLAAYIRVLYDLFGHVVVVPCANDLRKYLPERRAQGICNLVTNVNCGIGEEIGADFENTLGKVKHAMDQQKTDISCIKSLTVMELLFQIVPYQTARKIVEKSFSNPPIAFTNIGILDQKRLLFGTAEMTAAYMTGSIKYNPYFQLALSTFDNEAVLSVNFYGTQSDRDKIAHVLDCMVLQLRNAR